MKTTGIFLDAFKKSKINPIPKTEKSSCSFGELLMKYVYSFRSRLGAWLNCIIDNIYGSNIPLHSDIWAWWHSKSVRPEIRGSNVFLWRSLSPSQNVPFICRHDAHHFSLRTAGQRPMVTTLTGADTAWASF